MWYSHSHCETSLRTVRTSHREADAKYYALLYSDKTQTLVKLALPVQVLGVILLTVLAGTRVTRVCQATGHALLHRHLSHSKGVCTDCLHIQGGCIFISISKDLYYNFRLKNKSKQKQTNKNPVYCAVILCRIIPGGKGRDTLKGFLWV